MKNNTLLNGLSEKELSDIVERIVYLRTEILHMTQDKFASAIKISQTYLSLIEHGKKEITMSILSQISYSLQVNLDWLIYGLGSEGSIFTSPDVTVDLLQQTDQETALDYLQRSFSLKESEMDFLSLYLNLSPKDRQCFSDALKVIGKLQ